MGWSGFRYQTVMVRTPLLRVLWHVMALVVLRWRLTSRAGPLFARRLSRTLRESSDQVPAVAILHSLVVGSCSGWAALKQKLYEGKNDACEQLQETCGMHLPQPLCGLSQKK